MLAVIENATNDVTDMLHRMRELAVQATNDTNGSQDKAYLNGEVSQLLQEIDRVASQTQYNGQTVLNGDFVNKSIQVGTEANQDITFSIDGIKTIDLGLGSMQNRVVDGANVIDDDGNVVQDLVATIDLNSDPSAALQKISNAIEQVAGDRAEYGALQNRLEYTVSNLMNVAEFTTAARSRIEDADFAAESARLAKAQVLQQTGTAMLAQANASSQLALSLVR